MIKRIFLAIFVLIVVLGAAATITYWHLTANSNPHNYKAIGDIPTPEGFSRLNEKGFTEYLRNLPLKGKGNKVKLYTGGNANYQILNYAVLDIPLLNNWEQCADACIRLNAEYLYSNNQFDQIAYKDVNGKLMRYSGGQSRKGFEAYLKKVYGMASTYSLSKFLPERKLSDLKPGDVFVYPARNNAKYGHAVIVVDVAVNEKTGERAFLLAEGNTPARNIHVLRNFLHPFSTPWFIVDGSETLLKLGPFLYHPNEIRHF